MSNAKWKSDLIQQLAGVREGDVIIGIGDVDVKWSTHEEVVSLIKHARNDLSLKLIQPVEKPTQPSKVCISSFNIRIPCFTFLSIELNHLFI